jgi:hypothetical protein
MNQDNGVIEIDYNKDNLGNILDKNMFHVIQTRMVDDTRLVQVETVSQDRQTAYKRYEELRNQGNESVGFAHYLNGILYVEHSLFW